MTTILRRAFIALLSISCVGLAASDARAESGRPWDTGWTCAARVFPYGGTIRTDVGMIRVNGAEVTIDLATGLVRVLESGARSPVEIRVEGGSGGDTVIQLPNPIEVGHYELRFHYASCPGTPAEVIEYDAIDAPQVEELGDLAASGLLATNVRRGSPDLVYFIYVDLRTHPGLDPWLGLWEVGLSVGDEAVGERSVLDQIETWQVPIDCPSRGTPTEPRDLVLEAGAGAPGNPDALFASTTVTIDCDAAVRVDPVTMIPLSDAEAEAWDTDPTPPAPPQPSVDAGPRRGTMSRDGGGADPDSHRREHESCSAVAGNRNDGSRAAVVALLGLGVTSIRRRRPGARKGPRARCA